MVLKEKTYNICGNSTMVVSAAGQVAITTDGGAVWLVRPNLPEFKKGDQLKKDFVGDVEATIANGHFSIARGPSYAAVCLQERQLTITEPS